MKLLEQNINLQTLKKGNQELENWLRSLLSKNAEFEFHSVNMNNRNVGVLIIYRAVNQTVMFEKADYIRCGSYTKKLNEYAALQAKLWDRLRNDKFEEGIAKNDLTLSEALYLLDYVPYFEIKGEPLPVSDEGIAHYLLEEKILMRQDNGLFAITNLGAILFARRLSDFPRNARKAVRIVQYEGNNRFQMLKEDISTRGYVLDFENLIKYIEAIIPTREVIEGALRQKITAYPMLAIREALANALIHQDFSVTGTGTVVEVFDNRIEITNPGIPLIDIRRIIDNPPKSRNEKLAELMRRLKMCEELGTGWDKIIISCELEQLPAPRIEIFDDSTRVTLFEEVAFANISPEDKIWACYMHSCIKYVQGEQLTNQSLRNRFGLKETASAGISRLIKEAVKRKVIKPLDPHTAPKYMRYIPIWA